MPIKVGLAYSEIMLKHECIWDPGHIERPHRLYACYQECISRGLVEKCLHLEPTEAREEDLLRFHTNKKIETLKKVFMNH